MHGEQVALGALVAAAAHGSPLRDTLVAFFARLGLPTSPGDLGIDKDQLLAAVRSAPATRPDRYTILSDVTGDDEALSRLIDRAFLPA